MIDECQCQSILPIDIDIHQSLMLPNDSGCYHIICYPNPSRPLVSPHPISAARRRDARAWLAFPLLAPPPGREEARRRLGAAGASDHDRLPNNHSV